MKITKQARRDARQLLRACMANGKLDEAKVRKTVEVVLHDKPRGFLPLLEQFERLVKLELARRTARVESATALSPQLQSSITADLTKQYGEGLTFEFQQKPELLGGLRIQVGGDVYDGSVEGRLAELQKRW